MESDGLKVFLKSVGNAVYSLNTICVGLESISRGIITKPEDLTISWKTNNPKTTAITARTFAVKSALVIVEEALLEYLNYLSECPDQPKEILDAVQAKGAAKKIEYLSSQIAGLEKYWMPVIILLIRWRNIVIHNSNSSFQKHYRIELINSSEKIKENHAKIDISKTLDNFDSRKITLKDFTTMIAITLRYVRHVDSILSPQILSIESFRNQLISRNLVFVYKKIIGVNGLQKQKKKFETFIRLNFPSLLTSEQFDIIFKNRFVVCEDI